jgi:hypothetical protein
MKHIGSPIVLAALAVAFAALYNPSQSYAQG